MPYTYSCSFAVSYSFSLRVIRDGVKAGPGVKRSWDSFLHFRTKSKTQKQKMSRADRSRSQSLGRPRGLHLSRGRARSEQCPVRCRVNRRRQRTGLARAHLPNAIGLAERQATSHDHGHDPRVLGSTSTRQRLQSVRPRATCTSTCQDWSTRQRLQGLQLGEHEIILTGLPLAPQYGLHLLLD